MTPEYKKEVEKADERIRTAQIAQAEAVIKAKNDLYRQIIKSIEKELG